MKAMELYLSTFYVFILILVRTLSFISTAPILGHSVVPFQLKFWVSIFLSYIFLLTIDVNLNLSFEFLGFFILILKEVIVGLIMGFSCWGIFYAVQFAGHLIGFDIGFSTSTAFDPEHSEPVPTLSQFKHYLSLSIFLMLNGHHFLLRSLSASFEIVPISSFGVTGGLVGWGVNFISFVFITAIKISAPILVALFLTDIAIGILSRVFPQMNIFMFAFSVKIAVGFIALIIAMPLFVAIFKKVLNVFEGDLIELLKLIRA
jgi:flagellar biosynthetic protein FliR